MIPMDTHEWMTNVRPGRLDRLRATPKWALSSWTIRFGMHHVDRSQFPIHPLGTDRAVSALNGLCRVGIHHYEVTGAW